MKKKNQRKWKKKH